MSNVTYASPGGATSALDAPARYMCPCERVPAGSARVLVVAALAATPSSVSRLRRLARAVAQSRRLSAAAEEALTMVVSELATNAVLHSGSADLAVLVELGDTALTVSVRDSGRWRERPAPRCEAADMDTEFGRGLALVDAYSVDRSVHCSEDGTLVRVVIAL